MDETSWTSSKYFISLRNNYIMIVCYLVSKKSYPLIYQREIINLIPFIAGLFKIARLKYNISLPCILTWTGLM